MLVRQNQQQFRNANADVQLFYRNSTWNKPPGVSQIYMLLISGGGDSGPSGTVTTWWGAARNVPDSLVVNVSNGDSAATSLTYRASNGTNLLLLAPASTGASAGSAWTGNQFTATGLFQSIAGTTSSSSPGTTFLCGGAASGTVTGNYGYPTTTAGQFFLSPIITGSGAVSNRKAGIGCGSSGLAGGGGPGLVIIASW